MNLALTLPKKRKLIPIKAAPAAPAAPVMATPKPLYVAVTVALGRPHYGQFRIA